VGSVGVIFWWGDWEVLVIYEAVWRVDIGLELGMAEMESGSEYMERGCFLGRGSLK
jgi:hypothetical protein